MTRTEKKAAKELDAKLTKMCSRALVDHPISILEIPKVYAVAKKAAAEGKDDTAIAEALAAYVATHWSGAAPATQRAG